MFGVALSNGARSLDPFVGQEGMGLGATHKSRPYLSPAAGAVTICMDAVVSVRPVFTTSFPRYSSSARCLLAATFAATLALAACGEVEDGTADIELIGEEVDEGQSSGGSAIEGDGVGAGSALDADIEGMLEELQANGFCDPADIENDGSVTSMHFVVQGDLQRACFTDAGGDDQRLIDAWNTLTSVAPRDLYGAVGLLAGYESCDGCDTLAFVTTLDDESSFFLMAVDVAAGESDPDELRLTMLHELTHVFGQIPNDQLDVSVTDPADCDTYWNGNGCFVSGAYMLAWIDLFWPADLLDQLPGDGGGLDDDAAYRICEVEGGFTGSYAATSPEEDFAESFSAYVFNIDVPSDLNVKMSFFDDYPEFREMRDAALAEGMTGFTGSFDFCR